MLSPGFGTAAMVYSNLSTALAPALGSSIPYASAICAGRHRSPRPRSRTRQRDRYQPRSRFRSRTPRFDHLVANGRNLKVQSLHPQASIFLPSNHPLFIIPTEDGKPKTYSFEQAGTLAYQCFDNCRFRLRSE